jgi:hypothetical protein
MESNQKEMFDLAKVLVFQATFFQIKILSDRDERMSRECQVCQQYIQKTTFIFCFVFLGMKHCLIWELD